MPLRRTWSSSPFMSPPLLIILLPIIAFTFLFFALPSFLSATTHILRPASVHKTRDWDSLNIFLVLFAVLCGVFARRNDDESSPPDQQEHFATTIVLPPNDNDAYVKIMGEGGYVSHQWFGFSQSEERKVYDIPPVRLQSPATGVSRLRRSSSSYPDLSQESSWETGTDPFKFLLDDFEIDMFRSPATYQLPVDYRKRWTEVEQEEEDNVKEIQVETFEIRSSTPLPKPPAPPPPLPPTPPHPPAATVPRKERVDNDSELPELHGSLPPPPPTPPPPPSQQAKMRSEHKHGKSERRKSNVKKGIATVWASVLSNQKKRKKKQWTKTSHNHDSENVIRSSSEFPNNTTAPPPPPPPPPASVFHSLFKKGLGKSKKIHSVPPQPQPRPPLTSSKRKSQIPSETPAPAEPLRRKKAGRPPLPTKVSSFNDEAVNTGNRSPLIPVLRPFKLPEMNFVVRGDFVRTRSNHISRSGSPEREDVDVSSTTTTTKPVMNNGDGGGSIFCPSPDVNVKAATFIARLRGEWKLEKLNSLKEKANFRP